MLAGNPNETGGIVLFQYTIMMQPGSHLYSMRLCLLEEYEAARVCTGDNVSTQISNGLATKHNNHPVSRSSGLNISLKNLHFFIKY